MLKDRESMTLYYAIYAFFVVETSADMCIDAIKEIDYGSINESL